MRWKIFGVEEGETERRDTKYAEKKSKRQEGHGVPCPYGQILRIEFMAGS